MGSPIRSNPRSSMSSTISKLAKAIQKIEEALLAAAILTIAVLSIANVIGRLFGNPLAFAEEISQYCILVVTFVGLSYAASRGRHIRMTAIYDQLNKQQRRRMMIAINASTTVILSILTWYSCGYVYTVYQLGGIYPVLRVPFYVVYAVAPIGLFLGSLQYALATLRNLMSDDAYVAFSVLDENEEPIQQEI